MAIVIKKRIDLSYLGEDYKDSYLTFRTIAVKEFEALQQSVAAIEKDKDKALPFISEQLKERFIDGSVLGEKVTADDLEDLPADIFMDCFAKIRGEITAPKENS